MQLMEAIWRLIIMLESSQELETLSQERNSVVEL